MQSDKVQDVVQNSTLDATYIKQKKLENKAECIFEYQTLKMQWMKVG